MDGRTGSITVTALVGTGLATLVVSLTGVAGLSGDLQAAAAKNQSTTPVLSPGEELRDTKTTHGLVLKDACDKTKHAKSQRKADPDAVSTIPTPATTPTAASSAREF